MPNKPHRLIAFLATVTASAFAAWIAAASLAATTARALPIYAQQTGLPCGRCHVNPRGGGPRTAFGRAFAANGHRLPGGTRRGHRSDSHDYGPGYGHGPGMMGGYGPGHGYGPGMMDGYGGMGGYGR